MNKLILSFLVKKTPGGINDFMKNIDVVNMPSKMNPEVPLKPLVDENYKFNVRDLFVSNYVEEFYDSFPYYYYNGSLTYPQCDENVKWIIVGDLVPLGSTIIEMFNFHHQGDNIKYRGNNRAI